jgi:uncharacterized protein GlcG (DUF336 family)
MERKLVFSRAAGVLALAGFSLGAINAQTQDNSCANLPDNTTLKSALVAAVNTETSGLNNNMWATIVDRDGIVCAVAFSGNNRGSQWPASRIISAQKANTANSLSLDPGSSSNSSGQAAGLALSTANLFSAVQPGGSLFGLQESNPVDTSVAYANPSSRYGQFNDPMIGRKIGGINVFGGGLALYNAQHQVVGGLGVSGDTSCADHFIAWRVRNTLGLDHMAASSNFNLPAVGGVSGDAARPDNIVFDLDEKGVSKNGFGQPNCVNPGDPSKLPPVVP